MSTMLGTKLVTRHGNYESKTNLVSHSARGLAQGAERPSHGDPTYTFVRTQIHMVFVVFVTSCLPNSCKYVWIVEDGVEEAGEEG